jgi:Zn-dependent M16 (insulinase) family peptidase
VTLLIEISLLYCDKAVPNMPNQTHFKVIKQFSAQYAPASFTLYVSQRTGMRVAVCDRKGPKVNGYFALATEIHDDSGAPHTLEHLIFMGSKNYPHKGVLDKLANRAYSNTNAWTATDHTAYTLDSAGWDGFAQILPVYLEHVILPTLTDAGCYTEVHHVDGEGQDAGVVYSEMQGVQNTQEELMELQARRLLYPDGDGFRYETGGMMEQLRVLSPKRIRQFHKDMYQPKNLCLVLMGEVDHQDLLNILDNFETGILQFVPKIDSPFQRPWTDSKRTPLLTNTVVDTVEFPEDDESVGEIIIGFFGPDCNAAPLVTAMNVLLTYLADSSVTVLVNALVEKEQLASGVYFSVDVRPNIVVWFTLSSVATDMLAVVEKRFFEVLKAAANDGIDMNYMKECISRSRRQMKYSTESSNAILSECMIQDHLFGNRDGTDFVESLETLKDWDILDGWTGQQWQQYLKEWLADAYHVSILGKPSSQLSKRLKEEEIARVKEQRDRLGVDGLRELARKLEEAKAENDKPVPDSVIEKFEIPNTDSIHFFPTITARAGAAKEMGPIDNHVQKIVDADTESTPLFIHFEHIPSNFVHCNITVSTAGVAQELKPLLAVYLLNFFNTPILRDGSKIEFEQVVMELEKDTVVYDIDTGSSVGNAEILYIRMVVEAEKYKTAIQWICDMMFSSVFDEEVRTLGLDC